MLIFIFDDANIRKSVTIKRDDIFYKLPIVKSDCDRRQINFNFTLKVESKAH